MKTSALTLAILAALPLAAAADVSKEDLKKLLAAGISDDVILTFVRTHGPVQKLSADDVIELKQAGASERVLNSVMAPAPAPKPQVVERVVEKQVYVPQTTYVYDSTPTYIYTPTYSSSWCGMHYAYHGYCGTRTYYGSYPGYSYRSYCPPSIGLSYVHYGRRSGWGFRTGWCW
jgi:hypothetical protein